MDSRSRGLGFESPAPTSEHGNAMVSGSHQDGLQARREGGTREEEKEWTRQKRKGTGGVRAKWDAKKGKMVKRERGMRRKE